MSEHAAAAARLDRYVDRLVGRWPAPERWLMRCVLTLIRVIATLRRTMGAA